MGSSQSTTSASSMYTATAASDVAAAAATALTLHPTSNVKGQSFDRYVQIFFENQDYQIAEGDPNFSYLATLGIKLDNYWAITHPSQPNYVSALGADRNGVYLDSAAHIDADVESMIDLLEAGGVSWSIYGEDMPYSGFESDWVNQETGANMYVRKHNPMMSYDSATSDVNRLAKAKNLTMFYEELASNTLPQWIWITPNMTSIGHDTSVTVAGEWAKNFFEPLLSNENFNIDRTLIVLTWDECENYLLENRVLAILLGSAVPDNLVGTTDSTKFSHYSLSKTAEDNWSLGSLGKNDVDANSLVLALA
ncbi:Phosphate-repressible acid phosphatase [Cytospora mali]|uniref:Phosphate-repressible acid phosphatase n=1 Tax=Cytospora mali TaxID=578113 RepID=A0A194VHR2_CYTMA|nr:Phosphate-repressible acid phosphatase [Valsa mali]